MRYMNIFGKQRFIFFAASTVQCLSCVYLISDEASRFHLGRQRQHAAVICSGALLFSSRVLRPSLVTLCSHKSGRCRVELYHALISGTLRSTPLPWLPVLSNIEPPALRRKVATDKLVEKIVKHDSWPIQPDILSPPLLRLASRKPLWLDLQPVDIKSRWRHNWKSAQVVNSHLVCDPTIQQPGFDMCQLGSGPASWVG